MRTVLVCLHLVLFSVPLVRQIDSCWHGGRPPFLYPMFFVRSLMSIQCCPWRHLLLGFPFILSASIFFSAIAFSSDLEICSKYLSLILKIFATKDAEMSFDFIQHIFMSFLFLSKSSLEFCSIPTFQKSSIFFRSVSLTVHETHPWFTYILLFERP